MDNYIFDNFIANVKKNNKPLVGLGIRPVNWDEFKAVKKKGGKLNLANIANLYQWAKDVLSKSATELDFIFTYHPESPRYWLRNIENEKDDDGNYQVGINLETFMESKSQKKHEKRGLGFYIPDNYELAKIAMREFNKHYKNKHGLKDNSFRELASWESNNIEEIKSMAAFLEKKYVTPNLKLVLKRNKIKKVIFTKDSVDFEYYR